jgi:hypothetical protein
MKRSAILINEIPSEKEMERIEMEEQPVVHRIVNRQVHPNHQAVEQLLVDGM